VGDAFQLKGDISHSLRETKDEQLFPWEESGAHQACGALKTGSSGGV